jgi:cell wall-associated NlpC family hydrolase
MIGSTLVAAPAAAAPGGTNPPSPAALDHQIDVAANQLEIVVEQYDAIRVQLAATKAKEAVVAQQLIPAQAAVQAAQANIALIAAHAYESTRFSSFLALIEAGSVDDAINRITTLTGLALGRQQQIEDLQAVASVYTRRQQDLAVLDRQQSDQEAVLHAKQATILSQISKLRTLRLAAYGPTGMQATTPVPGYVPPFSPGPAGQAVKFAYAQIGKMYQWAAAGPDRYDCSGLTMAAWRSAGVLLPHNAAMQYDAVAHISRAQLRPGDLVFYYSPIHHVAIYIGSDRVIHAPTFGVPVQIAPIGVGPIAGFGRPA